MNILQQLVAQAQQKKQQLYNDVKQAPQAVAHSIANIGAAPHPVQINSPQVVNSIQHAKYGVLAQGNNRNIAINQLNNAQAAAQPSVGKGLGNLGNSFNNATAGLGRQVLHMGTQTAGDIAATIAQHPVTPWAPGGAAGRQELYGQQTFKPVIGGGQNGLYDSTRNHLQASSNPLLRIAAKPLAAGDVGLHLANDIPIAGAATRLGIKGAAKAAPTVVKTAEKVAPKAAPVLAKGAEALQGAAQTLDKGTVATAKVINKQVKAAYDKQNTIAANKATIANLNRQKAALQQRIQNTPVGNHVGAENVQRHIDMLDGRIASTKAAAPKLTVKDRLLAPNIGLGTRPVNSPVSDYHNDYAGYLQDLDRQAPGGNKFKANPNGTTVASGKTPFYRDFVATTGKAPTKADYKAEAVRQLQSGKADSFAQAEYDQLRNPDINQIINETNAVHEQPTATGQPTSPTESLPREAVPAPQKPASTVPQAADGGSLPKSTPIDPKAYAKQQIQAQETARKAGNPTGLDKIKAETANLKSKFVDSLAPIEDKLNTKITAENATGHITPQLDRALRADSIAGQYVKDHGLAKVIQKVPDTKEFDQYLIAKHAPAYEAEHGAGASGRNLEADKQLVASLDSKYGEHAKAINQYSQKLLDKAVDYGLVSKESATALKARYPDYVPLNRVFGEGELPKPPKGTGGGNASIGSQTVVQKGKGSQRAIESPLNSLVQKTQDVVSQGERNKAAQILTGYKDLPGNPFNLRQLAKDETVGNKHVISVLQDGKKVQYETTPEIANAAKSLSKEQLGLIGKILAVPTRVLRLGATGLNPAFTGANVVKDLASGALNSKNPLRSSVANPSVFLDALKASLNHNSKQYGELVREGAGGTSFDIARDAPKQNIAAIRAQKNAGTRIAYTVTHPTQLFRAAENTIGRSEEFSRALQYYGGKQGAMAKGANQDAAKVLGAHAARNNTVNFARAGDYGRVLNSVLPYLNAGIQGSRTFVRTAGERPAQTAAKLAILGFMPTATTTAWNLATPDRKAAYDDIKPYEKQGNLIIVPPHPVKDPVTGKWNVIKIPVSQEIANLNNVVRNGVETGLKDGSFSKTQLLGDLVGTTTSIQAQNGRQLLGQATPQAVKPVAETIFNKNFYTGNEIVPQSQKNLDPKDQYGTNTSGTARTIGNLFNLSPRQIDNGLSTAGGGLAKNLVNVSDNALAKAGVIKPDEVRGKSFSSAVQGRFSGAQGSNEYDAIDKTSADLTKQLKSTPEYKSMAPADKAKALNRLTSQITQTYTKDPSKPLSAKQQQIMQGKPDLKSYLSAGPGGSQVPVSTKIDPHSQKVLNEYNTLDAATRKQKAYTEKDYDYKVAQAKYDNAVANGSLSKAQVISQKDAVTKAKVGSSFTKDTRDLYGLSKDEVYNLITTDQNGKQIASDLLKYGDALQTATGTKNKFRTSKGVESFTPASVSGSGRGASLSTLLAGFKTPYSDMVKNSTKGSALARSAHLAKKKA